MWWDVFDRDFLIFLLSTKDQHHLRLRYTLRRKTHDSLFCGLKPQSFVTNTLKLSPEKIDKVKIATAYFLAILVYKDYFFLDLCCFDHQKEAIQSRSTLSENPWPLQPWLCYVQLNGSVGRFMGLLVREVFQGAGTRDPGPVSYWAIFFQGSTPQVKIKKKNKRVLINCHIMNIITCLSFWCLL